VRIPIVSLVGAGGPESQYPYLIRRQRLAIFGSALERGVAVVHNLLRSHLMESHGGGRVGRASRL